jgi:hypothetical protein
MTQELDNIRGYGTAYDKILPISVAIPKSTQEPNTSLTMAPLILLPHQQLPPLQTPTPNPDFLSMLETPHQIATLFTTPESIPTESLTSSIDRWWDFMPEPFTFFLLPTEFLIQIWHYVVLNLYERIITIREALGSWYQGAIYTLRFSHAVILIHCSQQ